MSEGNGLSSKSVARPARIGLPLIRWSSEEDRFLRDTYTAWPLSELELGLPGRTANAIKQRAGLLGLWGVKNLSRVRWWNDEELDVLYDYYPDNGLKLCCDFLPLRTKEQVNLKVKRLGIRRRGSPKPYRFSGENTRFIIENVSELGYVEIARLLGDTPDNVREKSCRNGVDCLAIDRKFNGGDFKEGDYSGEEVAYITERYPLVGGVCVALELGREPPKVISFASQTLDLWFNFVPKPIQYSVVSPVDV